MIACGGKRDCLVCGRFHDGECAPSATADLNKILAERGGRYGNFRSQGRLADQICASMRGGANWDLLPPHMRHALDMIATKISRCLMGDPLYIDNWRDIAGYATLVCESLEDDSR